MIAQPPQAEPPKCCECHRSLAKTREGLCLKCLRHHIYEEMSPSYRSMYSFLIPDNKRWQQGEHVQPMQEVAIRGMEDGLPDHL